MALLLNVLRTIAKRGKKVKRGRRASRTSSSENLMRTMVLSREKGGEKVKEKKRGTERRGQVAQPLHRVETSCERWFCHEKRGGKNQKKNSQ